MVQASGSEQHLLEFTGDITDIQSYNAEPEGQNRIRLNMVGDVLVTCSFGSVAGSGGVRFDWGFAGATVVAEVRVAGDVEIKAIAGDGERARSAGHLATPVADGDRLAFAVRDGQVYLQHNGQLAALAICGPSDADSFRSTEGGERQSCAIRLSAYDCSLVVNRITIQRDVYYIGSLPEYGDDELRGRTGKTLTLGANECYLLGDNSARSYDSRMFADVRSSDIFGVARLIYWPVKRWRDLQ